MRITEQLIRRRAEHNDGILADLQEVTLHQFEIDKIENLELCRHLRILYLQNNIIEKIENLKKLKELEYLNLALNNITKIENLEGCESLKKLDLTVNFIDIEDLEDSISHLKASASLEELYLMGNPCTEWEGFRDFVVAQLPQLKQLDGKDILPSQRIVAKQRLERLTRCLHERVKQHVEEKARMAKDETEIPEGAYTQENRRKIYLEMAKVKEEKENKKTGEEKSKKEPLSVYNHKGEIRQCNEGKYSFTIDEDTEPDKIIVEIGVPKYLDTSLIEVDVHPAYLRCVIKNKVMQLRLPAEVCVAASTVQRSKTTGWLRVCMTLLDPPKHSGVRSSKLQHPTIQPLQPKPPNNAGSHGTLKGSVSLRGIVKRGGTSEDSRGDECITIVRPTRLVGACKTQEACAPHKSGTNLCGLEERLDEGKGCRAFEANGLTAAEAPDVPPLEYI